MLYTTLTNWRIKTIWSSHLNRCRKIFLQNSTSIYDKNSLESGGRGNTPQRNEGHIWPTAAIILNGEKLIAFPVKSRTRLPTHATFIQYSFGSPSHSQEETEIKGIQTGKEEVKLSLFADNMILYIENPTNATRKLLELINEFGKVAAYKINTHKPIALLYINTRDHKEKLSKQLHLPLHQKE